MISPQSFVHPEAKIGAGVHIEPFAYVDRDVEIGANSWIGPNATLFAGSRIGKSCKIYPSAVIAAEPQDLKFGGEPSLAIIGDNTIVREAATINRGTSETGRTQVGKDCLVMATAHIAHDCTIGDGAIIVNGVAIAGHVTVGKKSILGGLTAVHQFVTIGEYCMVGGGSLVRKDVPPFVKASKEPLSYIGINSIGLRRNQFERTKILEIQNIYRVIYQSQLNNTQATELIEAEFTYSVERDYIIDFVRNSKRGIMKGLTKRRLE